MKKKRWSRLLALLLVLGLSVSLLAGCGAESTEAAASKEDAETIQVYLWTTNLYDTYAPYIQSQLPDVNIEFIVGHNDLDFYKFLQENGGLPDIITCCRFSLHDAAPLKGSLMNLAMTNEAGAVYNNYLTNYMNEDGSINWLPVCADARGFTADYAYDYTCMETLQGLSASALASSAGVKWRTAYSDPADTTRVGLDETVWPRVFARMEQFITDTGLNRSDLENNYDAIAELFANEQLAMYFGNSAGVQQYRDQGLDTVFMPFFNDNGEKWLMTTPYFQIALNRELENDEARRNKAMRVLKVMMSADAQNLVCAGQDTLSYSQDVPLRFTDALSEVRPVVEENHMYIRIASNDFFAVSQEVVSKMIAGEYDAAQAYRAFNDLLIEKEPAPGETVLTVQKGYSGIFHKNGGNASYSAMANTMRGIYGTDVLIAAANSFTGSVRQAEYTKKQAAAMVMPNGLRSYRCEMTGAELKETVKAFVEGYEGGLPVFNRGSLPVVSGIAIEVQENGGSYTLTGVTRNGQPVQDDDTFTVSCLSAPKYMEPLLADGSCAFEEEENTVRNAWLDYVSAGSALLAEPESYIVLRDENG